jgi:hypothetical protein
LKKPSLKKEKRMFINGINNYIKFGQLLPNGRTQIKSLKDFFYKTKLNDEEILKEVKDDKRIIIEFDPVVLKPIEIIPEIKEDEELKEVEKPKLKKE